MVIMPDADINKTTDAIIGSAFGSAGERCMAISVAVCVGKQTKEKIKTKLLEETAKLNVGPYTDEKSDFGPLNNKAHFEKVLGYIDAGEKEGAKLVADGRNFIDDDIHYSRNVCVLGMDVVDQLFPFEDPLGKRIKINGLEYFVIGITERQGEAFGTSRDNYIGIPITTYLEKYSSKWTSLRIHIESPSDQLYEKNMNEVIGHLRSIRKVQPKMGNDFEVVTNTAMIEQFSGFTKGIKFFALFVSVIALVVAGIGIMNIMLVSVTERIKEIGIRKAIGATKNDILTQFLMEAVFLSQFGGIVGIILGVSGGNIVSIVFNIPAVIPIDWAFIGLIVCSVIGIGFGIYPAWHAANLDPIDSLRYDK